MPAEARYIDLYFRDYISRVVPGCSAKLLQVMLELSQALSRQHSCLDLANREDKLDILSELATLEPFKQSNAPVTLHGEKLYLRRYFQYEKCIVERITTLNSAMPIVDPIKLSEVLKSLFQSQDEINWQQVAALQALTRKLTIITGGPGTGKTTTVARIITLLNTLNDSPLQIRLAAPTGKAAMRLSQSLSSQVEATEGLRVQTLHRLLSVRRDGRSFRFNAENPIAADVLIVDEASMIDLPMMYRVLTALPDKARLILVGDPDQLPSVETGNVLADLCTPTVGYSKDFTMLAKQMLGVSLTTSTPPHPLDDMRCHLQVSHRFLPDEGIGRLARNIAKKDINIPSTGSGIDVENPEALQGEHRSTLLLADFDHYFDGIRKQRNNPAELAQLFEQSRLLTPMREGDLGVEEINASIELALEAQGLKDPASGFYHGRPILILRNDYNLQLYNGDVGICIAAEEIDHPMVAFTNLSGETRLLLASRLPPHETCFAMTVHKAQGSEFESVTLILPTHLTHNAEQLLSRELVYTAITRARRRVKLYTNGNIWKQCMENSEPRVSGINDFFQEPPSGTSKQLGLFE